MNVHVKTQPVLPFLVFILLVANGFIAGCARHVNPDPYATSTPIIKLVTSIPFNPSWQNPIHLNMGEGITLNDGFRISFDNVLEDNRCLPEQAKCAQDANAKIQLTILSTSGTKYKMVFNSNVKPAQTAWAEGHSVQLVMVKPDLPIAAKGAKLSYEIWIIVLLI
jgi:hypothetical protein